MKNKNIKDLKNDYMNIEIPEELETIVRKTINDSKSNKGGVKMRKRLIGVAAGIGVVIGGLNISPAFADTLSQVPVVGGLVKLVTIKSYTVKEGNVEGNINIPKIDGLANKDLENNLNEEFLAQGKQLYDQLVKELPTIKEGHKYVGSDFEVKADTDDILSIEIIKEEIQASSNVTKKHYVINKNKQAILTLPAIFKDEKYVSLISENIKNQMRAQMKADDNKIYFIDQADIPEENFKNIDKEQDFYINSDGNLVICFDKYQVAPGYMGTVEFVIQKDIIDSLK